jgi:hypothetical protein
MSGPGRRPTHLCNHGIDLTVRGIKRATIKSSSDTRVRVITDPMARSCQAMATLPTYCQLLQELLGAAVVRLWSCRGTPVWATVIRRQFAHQ